jgi:hypothetical protein
MKLPPRPHAIPSYPELVALPTRRLHAFLCAFPESGKLRIDRKRSRFCVVATTCRGTMAGSLRDAADPEGSDDLSWIFSRYNYCERSTRGHIWGWWCTFGRKRRRLPQIKTESSRSLRQTSGFELSTKCVRNSRQQCVNNPLTYNSNINTPAYCSIRTMATRERNW